MNPYLLSEGVLGAEEVIVVVAGSIAGGVVVVVNDVISEVTVNLISGTG